MEIKTISEINEYEGTSVNPLETPDELFELYSVPSYDNEYPEIIKGSAIGSTKITVQENDVLICKINPRINRVWIVKHHTPYRLLASSEWIVVRNNHINPKYLQWYFSSPAFRDKITSQVAGIGGSLTRAQPKVVANYPVPILPIQKQNEVANSMDQLELLISLRKKQLQKLDDLVKARFVEMFGDPHRSKTHPYIKVSELTDVVSGGTPDRKNEEYWNDGTISWVKTTELQNNVITEVEERITEKGLSESSAKIVPVNTVLIAMYGQGKTRGMTGFLGIEACTNQACACLLPTNNINMQYLWHFLILSYDELRGLAQGGNQPNLNAGMIKDFPILVPPMEKQKQFVSFVSQVEKSKLSIQQGLEKLETLKKSLMQQYFG